MFQVAFVDLDDTLFSSLHKQGEVIGLEPASLLRDGSIISYASPHQRALTRWLHESDLVVPVTARTVDAFRRVLLEFKGCAVLSHGATVLAPDQTPDQEWARRVDAALVSELQVLAELQQKLQAGYGGPAGLDVRIAGEPGRPAYLMAKSSTKDAALVRLASETLVVPWVAANPAFMHHLNGNNLAVLPPSIGKRAAVAYLIEKFKSSHGDIFIVGAGDSLTDVPFLSLCHAALVPTRSQIWDTLHGVQGATQP